MNPAPMPESVVGGFAQPVRWPVDYFSNRRLFRHALFILGMLLINKLGPLGNLLCLAVLAAMAVRGPLSALKALSIVALIIIASDVLVQRGVVFSGGKFAILLIAGITLLRFGRHPFARPEQLALFAFGGVAAILAMLTSGFIAVSLLKLSTFVFGVSCLLSLASCRRDIGVQTSEWMFALILTVLGLSLLLLVAGQGSGEFESVWGGRFSGFRGAVSHPQTMGVVGALFAIYLTAMFMFTQAPRRGLLLSVTAGLLFLVYLSEARTGLLGYATAVALLMLMQLPVSLRSRRRGWFVRRQITFYKVALSAVMVAGALELLTGTISSRMERFIAKDDPMQASSVTAAFLDSREAKIKEAWETFQEHPVTGIGFGTDNAPDWARRISLFSASTEKGFLPTAILEETGVVGGAFFLAFVLVLASRLLNTARYVTFALFASFIIFNFTEMMFFSLGGMGLMCWVVIAATLATGRVGEESRDASLNTSEAPIPGPGIHTMASP